MQTTNLFKVFIQNRKHCYSNTSNKFWNLGFAFKIWYIQENKYIVSQMSKLLANTWTLLSTISLQKLSLPLITIIIGWFIGSCQFSMYHKSQIVHMYNYECCVISTTHENPQEKNLPAHNV